jgi:putative membrane-bound dehydrogenase-like protein
LVYSHSRLHRTAPIPTLPRSTGRGGRSAGAILVWLCIFSFGTSGSHAATVRIDDRTFTLPDGFTIEKVAGPPLIDRPVVADFDDEGRLYVADSSGTADTLEKQLAAPPHRIVRLDAADAQGHFTTGHVFADKVMFPEGILWHQGSVYAAGVPSIWKFTDTRNAGVADQRMEWFAGKTMTHCGNDLHGPYAGPDGWLYWCKGAFAEQTYTLRGNKPFVTRASHIFRSRVDGTGIEPVMTGGMDNPVEVVFTPGGERIFTTTFLQSPAGGKRDGIIHAVYGGVYGKDHDVIEGHPRTGPDLMPVLVHLGPAACCGLVRYESDGFGSDYQNNLFASCFNLHKVTRHILTEQGATFVSKDSDFLVCDNVDFHPTHLIEDADGSLLVIDTGGWYKLCCPTSVLGKPDVLGAIYRVTRKVGVKPPQLPRELVRGWKDFSTDNLAAMLDDPIIGLRRRAMQSLADAGPAAIWSLKRVPTLRPMATERRNIVWTACRIDHPDARALVRGFLNDTDESVRQAAAHAVSVWRDATALPGLLELLSTGTPQNQRVAAEALGRIGDSQAVGPLLSALAKPADRVLEHSLIYALIEIGDAKATAAGLASDIPSVHRGALIALDQMVAGGLQPTAVVADLSLPDASLRDAAAWIASHHAEWGDALVGAMRAKLEALPASNEDRDRLQHQLAQLAKSDPIAQMLIAQLRDGSTQPPQRRVVIGAMADSGLRKLPDGWLDALVAQTACSDSEVARAAVAALGQLPYDKQRIKTTDAALRQLADREDLPAGLRLEALSALRGFAQPISPAAFKLALGALGDAQPADQRLLSAKVLGHAVLTGDQLTAVCGVIPTASPLEIPNLVASFARQKNPAVGTKLVAALRSARSLRSLRPADLNPLLAHFGPDADKELHAILDEISPDSSKQQARLDQLMATLPAGDKRRGQALFNSPRAACSTCHAMGYVGGNVGPDLTRVGQIRTKRDLLESVVFPSASFVQTFEPMMVETTDGEHQYGIPRRNDSTEVMLVTGPNQEVHIPREKVKRMLPGKVSLMPEGFDQQFTAQELADLIAFLQNAK